MVSLVVLAAAFVGTAGWAQSAPKSVKGGVYSAAQAKRGEDVTLEECSRCHSASLLGGENNTPPLTGEFFQDKWNGMTLRDLFQKMYTTMPSDSPGRLSKSDYADVLAYVLSVNKYPAGPTDLKPDLDALAQIKIEP